MQRTTKHIEDYKKKREAKTEEKKKKLNTKKKRAKEQRERFTRCESPNSRPIKKGTRKKKQATGHQIYLSPQKSAGCIPSKCTTSNTTELNSKC